jgi:hypothetical protein
MSFWTWLFPSKTDVRYWQGRAYMLRRANTGVDNCFEQAKLLSREMREAKIKHYLVDGKRERDGEFHHHNWIEMDGVILDPAQSPNSKYVVVERFPR